MSSYKFQPVPSNSSSPSLSGKEELDDQELGESRWPSEGQNGPRPNRKWMWAFHAVFGIANVIGFMCLFSSIAVTDSQCVQKLSAYASGADQIKYEVKKFIPFIGTSKYRGTPTAELDEAWSKLERSGYVTIPKDDMINKLHKNETYVTVDTESGREYLGNLEVYHQIHCLNLIRQYTYEEEYRKLPEIPVPFSDPDEVLRSHVDHCIDYIREFIMCAGDLSVHTYYWVEGKEIPWPDFAVERKCRTWESIEAYAGLSENLSLPPKPSDAVEYENPMHGHHH